MPIPKQSSWVVRKIMGARDYLKDLQNGHNWISGVGFSVRRLYMELQGPY